jgi:hypothetical protein
LPLTTASVMILFNVAALGGLLMPSLISDLDESGL